MSKSIPHMIYKSILHEIYEENMMLCAESLMTLSDIADWMVE